MPPTIGASTNPVTPDVAWFRERVPIDAAQWYALDDADRRRAFTVSGVTSLDVLNQVWQGIDRAVAQGTSFDDFRKQMQQSVGNLWGGRTASRVETIYRTNVQHAYSAGRYAQMSDPEVKEVRPFWEFFAILDAATTPICRPLEGVVRNADDPWWNSHIPPLHFSCRSSITTLSARQAGHRGVLPMEPHEDPQEGFGGAPNRTEWAPQAQDYPPALWQAYSAWMAVRATPHDERTRPAPVHVSYPVEVTTPPAPHGVPMIVPRRWE